MLSVKNLSAQYGRACVLVDVGFEIDDGEIVSIVGANGAGKSTLVKVLSGLLHPTSGTVVFRGEDISALAPYEIVRRGIVHVPEGRRLFGDMTVMDNLLLGSTNPEALAYRSHSLGAVLDLFPRLRERRSQLAATLSGGEQQMVAIARGLMARPRLLMLDEPSLGLAPKVVTEIFGVIRRLNSDGLTVLLIEQNVRHSLAIADRGIVLGNGKVALADRSDALLRNEHTRRAYLGL